MKLRAHVILQHYQPYPATLLAKFCYTPSQILLHSQPNSATLPAKFCYTPSQIHTHLSFNNE